MSKKSNAGGGISFGGALFLLFLGLKLTKCITWSWWWVTAPIWAPIGIVAIIFLVGFLVALAFEYFK